MTKIDIILLGESGVGKTTLLFRFKTGEFQAPETLNATLGVDFHIKKVILEGKEITFFIWDTVGDEKRRALVRSYYRKGEGVLLVYDVTNAESFFKLSSWLKELRNVNERAEVLIAGNKDEDSSKKSVAVSVVKSFAKEENLEYIEMSAQSGKNVEEAFLRLAKKILIAKGILRVKDSGSQETDQHNSSSANEKISPKNSISDKDIIRLEDTPMVTSHEKKGCSC